MNIWFTSDLHLGHEKIAVLRGFDSAEEHDDEVIRRIKLRVAPGDHLWILGDISSGGRASENYALERLAHVAGSASLHLVAGNHDSCHPMFRDSYKHQRRFLEVFDSVQAFARRKVEGRYVMLSHFPYTGDHTDEDRHWAYRLRADGLPVLHGHTHSSQKVTRGKQIHVGWDAWGGPVSLSRVAELIQ